jgi:hypothetical protein
MNPPPPDARARSKATPAGRSLRATLARHEWAILGALAALAFVLGVIGYAGTLHFESEGGEYTWWDVVYLSVQLFIFESPDATAGWPLHLQVARALAPLVLIYSAAIAVWSQVRSQVALYALQFHKRRFVVVCGIGEMGFRLARAYCTTTHLRVVIIDREPLNPLAHELEGLGAIMLHGNAIDPLVLMRARVAHAKELFLCTGDDQANIAIAKNVERLTRRVTDAEIEQLTAEARAELDPDATMPPFGGLRCFLCVDSPLLYEVFANHPFFDTSNQRYQIRLFNRRETIARNVFRHCAPDLYYRPSRPGDAPVHILFVGFEALARELILQVALTAHYPDFRLPRITVMTPPDCRDLVERFLHRYPHLEETVDIRFVYADPLTVKDFQWRDLQKDGVFTVCYFTANRDVECILSARRLNRLRRLSGMPPVHMVVLLNQQTFLAEILDDNFLPITPDKTGMPDYEPIEYYETLDETITIDMIVNEALDTLAEALHLAYVKTQLERGDTPEKNASIRPWQTLPPQKKRANQNAAAHLEVKLRIAGCRLEDAGADAPAASFPPDERTMEVLAQLEHRRWMADKYLAGYTLGPSRDDDRMLHPDLIPWEGLTERDRDKDRDNIRQIPNLVALRGKKICAG